MAPMLISLKLSYAGGFEESVRQVAELEQVGLDLVWVAEAYGFDAVSLMGYLAARTERVEIAAGILPIYTRTPTLLAMTAVGVDSLSHGRCVLGLGASGPRSSRGCTACPRAGRSPGRPADPPPCPGTGHAARRGRPRRRNRAVDDRADHGRIAHRPHHPGGRSRRRAARAGHRVLPPRRRHRRPLRPAGRSRHDLRRLPGPALLPGGADREGAEGAGDIAAVVVDEDQVTDALHRLAAAGVTELAATCFGPPAVVRRTIEHLATLAAGSGHRPVQ